jgi:hypothetical protein
MPCAVNEDWLIAALDAASKKHIHGGCKLLQSFTEQMIEDTEELVHMDQLSVSASG